MKCSYKCKNGNRCKCKGDTGGYCLRHFWIVRRKNETKHNN